MIKSNTVSETVGVFTLDFIGKIKTKYSCIFWALNYETFLALASNEIFQPRSTTIIVNIYYKKSLDVFSRPWIFVSFMIFWILKISKNNIYYDPTLTQSMSELLVLIALISGWFVYRKKYPEEFGLKS